MDLVNESGAFESDPTRFIADKRFLFLGSSWMIFVFSVSKVITLFRKNDLRFATTTKLTETY